MVARIARFGRVFALAWLGIGASVFAGSASAQTLSHRPDPMLHDSFDGLGNGPATDSDASRFLTQATFGPTLTDIAHLRAIGYQAWLNEQFAKAAATQVPYLDWVSNLPQGQNDVYDDTRIEIWSINSVGAPDPSRSNQIPTDQLRQRVAFALSEMFVVSNNNGTLAYQPWSLASYYDLLAADAFGNYRTLLEDVTKHPAMGIYLSMIQNRKADAALNIHPDENYAREVMQLFSVGLVMLNIDGTPKLSGGVPIPTYDQSVVRGFAAVFTGWNWNNFGCGDSTYTCCNEDTYSYCGPSNGNDQPWMRPMQPVEAFHDDTNDKQLLNYPGVALTNGVLPHSTAQAELTAALDNIFKHPNVGPFVATHLIRRLVTSNPTPAYVQRVAQIFNDDGSAQHVRGNLKAVVAAVLLDPEARFGQWQQPDTFGKLREPLLKVSHLWRAMSGRSTGGRIGTLNTYPGIETLFGEAPLRAPTVFNFFKPSFQQPGEVITRGLVSPEFQILSDTTAVSFPNDLYHQIFCNYVLSDRCYGSDFSDTLQLNEARDAAMAVSSPAQLVDFYSGLFMSGQMSPYMRDVLITRLSAMTASDYGSDLGLFRVQQALYLIQNSPEYSIQK